MYYIVVISNQVENWAAIFKMAAHVVKVMGDLRENDPSSRVTTIYT